MLFLKNADQPSKILRMKENRISKLRFKWLNIRQKPMGAPQKIWRRALWIKTSRRHCMLHGVHHAATACSRRVVQWAPSAFSWHLLSQWVTEALSATEWLHCLPACLRYKTEGNSNGSFHSNRDLLCIRPLSKIFRNLALNTGLSLRWPDYASNNDLSKCLQVFISLELYCISCWL